MLQRTTLESAVGHRNDMAGYQDAQSRQFPDTSKELEQRIRWITAKFSRSIQQQPGMLTNNLPMSPYQLRADSIDGSNAQCQPEIGSQSAAPQVCNNTIATRVVRAIPRRVVPFSEAPDWRAVASLPRTALLSSGTPTLTSGGRASERRTGGRTIPEETELTRKDMPPLPSNVVPIRTSDDFPVARRAGALRAESTRAGMFDSHIERELRQRSAAALAAIARLNGEVRNVLLQHPDIVSCCPAEMSVQHLVIAALRFARSSSLAHATLARALQKVSGDYGAHAGEPMSVPVQKKVIRHWIVLNLFGESMEAWIYGKLLRSENARNLRVGDICRLVMQQAFGSGHAFHAHRQQILTQVLSEELPLMACFREHAVRATAVCKRYTEMKLSDFEWGQLHAGQRFVQSMGLAGKFDLEESRQLGEVLLIQLKKGVLPNAWWEFFRLPAIMRYTQNHQEVQRTMPLDGDDEMVARALVDYALAHDEFMEEQFPITKFKYGMDHFLTRLQLAQQEIKISCAEMSSSSYLNNPATSTCSKRTVPGQAQRQTVTLPDINSKFKEQINALAELYQRIDGVFLIMAWNLLADDDFDCINRSEVRWANVKYSAADVLNKVPFVGANHHARESLTLYPMPGVEFLIVTSPGQAERVYALQKKGLEYVLLRVDRNISNYHSLFAQDLGKISNPDFKLKVSAVNGLLKGAKDDLSVLLDRILQKNKQEFSTLLHVHGYEETTYEMALRMVKSLIPFYTCVNAIKDDRPDEAALSCPLDILSLAPGIGAFSRLSIRLGQIAGCGAWLAARNAASGIVLRNSLQVVLKQAVRDIAQYAMLPTAQEINGKTLIKLCVPSLRSFDPGIELLGSIGVASVSQCIRLGRAMTMHSRRFNHVLDKLVAALPGLPASRNGQDYVSAFLPGMEQPVRMLRLGGDQLDGQDIYVRVHPETGQPFGRKYVRLPDGTLDPVPVVLAQRLRNILEQGLGGKGGARQGVAWGKDGSALPVDALHSPQSQQSPQSPQSPQASSDVVNPGVSSGTSGQSFAVAAMATHSLDALHSRQVLQRIENIVRHRFNMAGGQIYYRQDRRCEYHLDWDVFIEGNTKSILAFDTVSNDIIQMSPRQAEARVTTVSHDQRTAVLRALGIDLDVDAILRAPAPHFGTGRALEKRISYIWVGDQAISQEVLDTLAANRDMASQAGYQVYFYLSLQSFDVNYPKLKQIFCDNGSCLRNAVPQHKIQLLETTDFYEKFRVSNNFAQYQDAIDGNGGVATNYASAADILRFALLADQGGLYMDVDDRLLPDIGMLELKADDNGLVLGGLLSSELLGMDFAFGTSFFGAHKNSMVLKKILTEISDRYQQEEYRRFYKDARPSETESEAMNIYAKKLLYLTGPGVFNSVVLEQLPAVKQFVELAKLIEISNKPEYSDLVEKLTRKIASEEEICPLSAAHTIGSMNSWLKHR